MDIATLTNAPREVTLDGATYKVSALKLRDWGRLQAYLKDHGPSPIARIRSEDLAGLNEADRRAFLREAFLESKNWPPRVGSVAWMEAIDDTPGGNVEFLTVVLSGERPLPRAEAEALAEKLDGPDYVRLLMLAFGQEPPDPKGGTRPGPGPTPTPTGPTATGTNGDSSSTISAAAATD